MSSPLSLYREKRNFDSTAEPRGSDDTLRKRKAADELAFVVQKHAASHLHFDLRLEVEGVMKSWAVPKGPSQDPEVKRLAMEVEDHPMEYNSFEGTIPKGQYGGGTVMLWDRGTYTPDELQEGETHGKAVQRGLDAGKLSFSFHGERLNGSFALVRTRRSNDGEKSQWLLIKHRDEFAAPGSDIVAEITTSVDSGRTMEQIAAGDGVWHSDRAADELESILDAFTTDAIEPMTQSARKSDLDGGIWAIEPRIDGTRVLAFAANGIARLVSLERGYRIDENAEPAASTIRALTTVARNRVGPLVMDAYLVTESGDGSTLVAIDVLLDHTSLLVEEPYIERRMRLEEALGNGTTSSAIRVAPMTMATHDELDDATHFLGTEDIVAKRIDTPYEAGESEYWRVVSSAPEIHSAASKPAAMQRSRYEMIIPLDKAEATVSDGEREVSLTNMQKPFWPELGITKGHLLRYYAAVSPYLLPHIVDRAMVMKRYPHGAAGEFFFMKRAPTSRPDWIETVAITHASASVIDFPMVQNLASLLWVINLGCIDLNPWYSRRDDIDRPDFLHFDLDPVPGADFAKVRDTAVALRALLDELKMPSFPKTSGSKGIHVYIPIVRGPRQKQVWTIAKAIAVEMEKRYPKLVTAEYRIAKRPEGRVLVDYNQNAWGRTLASIYSVRPRPLATVSVPITWEEIGQGAEIEDFTLHSVPDRLSEVGDLWAPLLASEGRVQLEPLL